MKMNISNCLGAIAVLLASTAAANAGSSTVPSSYTTVPKIVVPPAPKADPTPFERKVVQPVMNAVRPIVNSGVTPTYNPGTGNVGLNYSKSW